MADQTPTETGPSPPPDGLPDDVWGAVEAFVAAEQKGGSDDDPAEIARLLLGWCDGRSADSLEQLLDALRDRGAYPISLEMLEAAWNSDLPAERLGRVAEDWIGTVLHGIGDRVGAAEVAAHLVKGALEQGPQFAGDLGHVMLQWELVEAAEPLIEAAAKGLPGDMAARFNLGVVRKLQGDYAGAAGCFSLVLKHHQENAAWWNLGICAVARQDWPTARGCWSKLGIRLPRGQGDYAAEGELVPVQVKATPGAPVLGEVLWGARLGPARVALRGIARFAPVGYGDVVLVDGVQVGQTRHEGRMVPVVPMLSVFRPSGGRRVHLTGPVGGPASRKASARLVSALQSTGWPASDFTGLDGQPETHIVVIVPPGRSFAATRERIVEAKGVLPLDLSPLDAEPGVPPDDVVPPEDGAPESGEEGP